MTDSTEKKLNEQPKVTTVPQEFIDFISANDNTINNYIYYGQEYAEDLKKLMRTEGLLPYQKGTLASRQNYKTFVATKRTEVLETLKKKYQEENSEEVLKSHEIELYHSTVKRLEVIVESANTWSQFNEMEVNKKKEIFSLLQETGKIIKNFSKSLRILFQYESAPWGSFRSRGGSLVVHDFVKPLNQLGMFIELLLEEQDLNDAIEMLRHYLEDVNYPLLHTLTEILAEAKVVDNVLRTEVSGEEVPSDFKTIRESLISKLEGKVPRELQIKVNGDNADNYFFSSFEVWMDVHTFVLNALDNGATLVTIEVNNEDPKFTTFRIYDDINIPWSEFNGPFLRSYEKGKSSVDIPWLEIEGGGEMASYTLGQNKAKYKIEEEVLSFVDLDGSKYVELKFPK